MQKSHSGLTEGKVWARYAGTREHYAAPGIPARDLSPEEVEHYGIELLQNARCYEFVPVEETTPGEEPGQSGADAPHVGDDSPKE